MLLRITNLCVERMSVDSFLSSEGLSRDGRNLRSRSQPRRAAHHGNSVAGRRCSCQTETLYSSRNLPNDGAAPELGDDRNCDVAVAPATSEAGAVQDSS